MNFSGHGKKFIQTVTLLLIGLILDGCVWFFEPVNRKTESFIFEQAFDGKVIDVSLIRSITLNTRVDQKYRNEHPEEALSPSSWEYQVLQNSLKKYPNFSHIKYSLDSNEKLRIVLFYDYSASHKGFCEITLMTWAIIPCWGDLDVHHVEYQLNTREKSKTFKYTYKAKGIIWIGLLPLIWVSLLTNSQEQALESTFYTFLEKAKKAEMF